jgi:hypothetical protein
MAVMIKKGGVFTPPFSASYFFFLLDFFEDFFADFFVLFLALFFVPTIFFTPFFIVFLAPFFWEPF